MITFFTILFIILGVNAVVMYFGLSSENQKAKKPSARVSKTSIAEIHPIDLITSKYKKAV